MTLAAALVAGVAGCSSHQVDREAWARDLNQLGVTVKDWDTLEKSMREVCAEDDPTLFLAAAKDNGTSMKVVEANYRNVCPDRIDVFNEAVAKMTQTSAEFDIICRTPKSERTEQQQMLAEAVGC